MGEAQRSTIGRIMARDGFRRLWIAGWLANTARWLEILATALYTLEVTGSAIAVAIVTAARQLPLLFFGAFAGAISDALDRRLLLLGGFALAAANATLVAFLAWADLLAFWQLLGVALLSGVVWAGEMSTRRRMIGETAEGDELQQAIAIDSMTGSATRTLGPILGGIVFELSGMTVAFIGTATAQWIAVFLILGLRHSQETRPLRLMRILSDVQQGLAVARGNATIRKVLIVTIVMNACGFSYSAMVAPIGDGHFHVSPSLIGLLAAAEPVGGILGGLLLATGIGHARPMRIFVGGALLFLCCLVAMSSGPYWLALLLLMIGGLGTAGFANLQTTLVLQSSPPAMRSGLLGLVTVCIGVGPIGALTAGALTSLLGPPLTVSFMATIGLVAVLAVQWIERGR